MTVYETYSSHSVTKYSDGVVLGASDQELVDRLAYMGGVFGIKFDFSDAPHYLLTAYQVHAPAYRYAMERLR